MSIKSIFLCCVLLILCGCKPESQAAICSKQASENFDIVLHSIRHNDYKKFINHIACLEDVNIPDRNGISLLMYAAGYVEFLATAPDDDQFKSGRANYLNDQHVFVSELLKYGSKPGMADNDGNTALTATVYHNRIASTWLILKKGGDPNFIKGNNVSPIMVAAKQCHHEVYEMLLDFAGDPTLENESGDNAEYFYKQCQR